MIRHHHGLESGIEDENGVLVGRASNKDLATLKTPDGKTNFLVPVVDACGHQVGSYAQNGGVYFTNDEMQQPGFNLEQAIPEKIPRYEANAARRGADVVRAHHPIARAR